MLPQVTALESLLVRIQIIFLLLLLFDTHRSPLSPLNLHGFDPFLDDIIMRITVDGTLRENQGKGLPECLQLILGDFSVKLNRLTLLRHRSDAGLPLLDLVSRAGPRILA